MRRFSQRNSLVTLSDINITPLLDLAFVLLIIFVITTPLLEQGLNLRLPQSTRTEQKKLDPRDIRTVDVSPQGLYKFRNVVYQTPDKIAAALRDEQKQNPNLVVAIRGDQDGPYKHVTALIDRLEQAGVVNVSLRTTPATPSKR
jgi:biopolymer transport protein ExbD/biopolymer transport protein TolR